MSLESRLSRNELKSAYKDFKSAYKAQMRRGNVQNWRVPTLAEFKARWMQVKEEALLKAEEEIKKKDETVDKEWDNG